MSLQRSDRNRGRFDNSLAEIEHDLLELGNNVLEMVALATRVAIDDDPSLSEEVCRRETQVDEAQHRIVERVLLVMALEGPVAGDLMRLASTFAIISELEKIGDEATKLAIRVCKLHGEFPYELRDLLQEISKQAQANLQASLRLYTNFDEAAAQTLIRSDDLVDRTYKNSRNAILEMMRKDGDNLRQLLRCAEIFHALEHVSDHTVDMAKRLSDCHRRFSPPDLADRLSKG